MMDKDRVKNVREKCMSRQLAFALLAGMFLQLPAHAGNEANFSLALGMTFEEVRAAASSMTKVFDDRNILIYAAELSPSDRSSTESYRLLFSFGKLVKIRTIVWKVADDIFGMGGKSKYTEIRAALVQKYGEPVSEVQTIGKKGFTAPAEFYTCLTFPECGEWNSQFRNSEKGVFIQLDGAVAAGRGQLIVEEESVDFLGAVELYKWIGRIIAALVGCAIGCAVAAIVWKILEVRRGRVAHGPSANAVSTTLIAFRS